MSIDMSVYPRSHRSSQLAALFAWRRESVAERRERRREAPPRAAAH